MLTKLSTLCIVAESYTHRPNNSIIKSMAIHVFVTRFTQYTQQIKQVKIILVFIIIIIIVIGNISIIVIITVLPAML